MVSVLIPVYNEEKRIFETVKAALSVPEVEEVLVIDDASTDGTVAMAKKAGAKVIQLAVNVGKGGALNHGVPELKGNVVALLDGDLGVSAAEVGKLIIPIVEGDAEMTVARFPPARKKGGFGMVKSLARAGIKYYTGLVMEAPLSGQRVMTRQVLDILFPFASGFGVEVAMTITAARKGFRIMEVPVKMSHKETGRDLKGFLHRGKQFYDVTKVLWSFWRNGKNPNPQ